MKLTKTFLITLALSSTFFACGCESSKDEFTEIEKEEFISLVESKLDSNTNTKCHVIMDNVTIHTVRYPQGPVTTHIDASMTYDPTSKSYKWDTPQTTNVVYNAVEIVNQYGTYPAELESVCKGHLKYYKSNKGFKFVIDNIVIHPTDYPGWPYNDSMNAEFKFNEFGWLTYQNHNQSSYNDSFQSSSVGTANITYFN